MSHAPAGLIADAHLDHLVVSPQSAIEKDKRAAGEPPAQGRGHTGATRNKEKSSIAASVKQLESNRVSSNAQPRISAALFEIKRYFSRHRESANRKTRISG
jgi:hypothetical protein